MICSFPRTTLVRQHDRSAHAVRGHFRDSRYGRIWIGPHIRCGSTVNEHCRS